MPKHSGGQGRKKEPEREPIDKYGRLKYHEQFICHQYWLHLTTGGKSGWNTTEAGSVYHQRSSAYLLSLGSQSWFRHLGHKMVTLAQSFQEKNQVPPAPFGEKIAPKSANTRSSKANDLPPPIPSLAAMPTQHPQTPRTPTMKMDAKPAAIAMSSTDVMANYPRLALPMSWGSWKKFDYTLRRKVERIAVRILTHTDIELGQDMEYEWITPRILKLRIAWPDWFLYAEQMCTFVLDDDGVPLYPPNHSLTESFAENNMEGVGEDGRRWEEGYVHFEKDINEDTFQIERLNIDMTSKNLLERGIQLFAQVQDDRSNLPSSAQKITNDRTARLGTGARESTAQNIRKRSDEDDIGRKELEEQALMEEDA